MFLCKSLSFDLTSLSWSSVQFPGQLCAYKILASSCACMLSCFSCVQLFVILLTVACQAPLFMGFSKQEYWSGVPSPSPGDLPDWGMEATSLASPALAGGFFTTGTILGIWVPIRCWHWHKLPHLILPATLWGSCDYHIPDKERQTQRASVACSVLHSKLEVEQELVAHAPAPQPPQLPTRWLLSLKWGSWGIGTLLSMFLTALIFNI